MAGDSTKKRKRKQVVRDNAKKRRKHATFARAVVHLGNQAARWRHLKYQLSVKNDTTLAKILLDKAAAVMARGEGDQLSMTINTVFDQIGVNKEMIEIRRSGYLQIECNETAIKYTMSALRDRPFCFGSQSEGTTTLGLQSDMDTVLIPRSVLVVQTSDELLHISEDLHVFELKKSPTPGYFILFDPPDQFPNLTDFMSRIHHKEATRFLKNSFSFTLLRYGNIPKKEGPAIYHETTTGESINELWGFPCIAWPLGVPEEFLDHQRRRTWPSKELTDRVLKSECFLVPKGSDIGENSDIEWRISFSFGERLLMFDLNTIQIRCYILMKYIKTTFLDDITGCEGVVSSYICKTVLFHVISRTHTSDWIEGELLAHLQQCLTLLRTFIVEQNCPHFIMPSINLLARKLDNSKSKLLSDKLQAIINSNGGALHNINVDNFGCRLLLESQECTDKEIHYAILRKVGIEVIDHYGAFMIQTNNDFMEMLSRHDTPLFGHSSHNPNLPDSNRTSVCNKLRSMIASLYKLSRGVDQKDHRMIVGVKLQTCRLSSLLGSLLASKDLEEHRGLSHNAFQWLLLGMQCSNATSSYLKLASILFADGGFECLEFLLNDVENILSGKPFVSHCVCEQLTSTILHNDAMDMFALKSFRQFFRENVGYCLTFLPTELLCCPREMQYEIYRTTLCDQRSLQKTNPLWTSWMKCAVIPPVPMLYFLQYKLYKERNILEQSQKALNKLKDLALDKVRYKHQETVLNIVAQCLENEGDVTAAMHAYRCSLILQPNYNAARILLCCNLYKQFKMRKC